MHKMHRAEVEGLNQSRGRGAAQAGSGCWWCISARHFGVGPGLLCFSSMASVTSGSNATSVGYGAVLQFVCAQGQV
ncbi:hypothetical protein VTJ04DRAFT_3882 [Mycothermus thermophilus]|uniref:uncharacterized protein n=1 Tax=Humicola insolens TaxID=85995 RepID=UPI0037423034